MAATSSVSHLVVIGSSAGGIEALSTLVATLSPEFPAPLVLAQHLDPTRPSHLEEILARRSRLPVRTISDHARLEPGIIFVVPANQHVEITNGTLHLRPEAEGRSKPSVDLLFSSAAAAYGERLIAVILTGTGSDGAVGATAAKEAGGTVLVQDPLTSAYPGMALALPPTAVDIVAPLERIGPLLTDLLTDRGHAKESGEKRALEGLLQELRVRYGLDFTQYKQATLLRRVQRRILATATQTLDGYRTYLSSHPQEAPLLTNSLLIKVTEFFRDPGMFRYLQDVIAPELLAYARTHEQTLRCWSAGCATGEEAYSLAIVLAEALGAERDEFQVRIFATDADPDAVAFARQGIYPAKALAKLPPELVARYFTLENDTAIANKRLRAMVVFGQHDLAQRAPFPRMDLVLCRNVLIYFTPELQQRTLRLFTYALRQDGLLVLGKAETLGALAPFFQSQHKQHHIYRRQGERVLLPPATYSPLPTTSVREARKRSSVRDRRPAAADGEPPLPEEVLLSLPVGVVVVNHHYDIQSINLTARRLLEIHRSAQGEDLIHLVQASLSLPLRVLIDRAFRERETTAPEEVTLEPVLPGVPPTLRFIAHPYRSGQTPEPGGVVVVLVEEITASVEARRMLQEQLQTASAELERVQREAKEAQERIRLDAAQALEEVKRATAQEREQVRQQATSEATQRDAQIQRLVDANRQLLEANQELTRNQEDLRLSNQELLLGAEEAQASVEEVETLNEEYQASNEELETLNEELQATIEELNTTNDDLAARSQELQQLVQTREYERARLEAILRSMGDALLVVNQAGVSLLTNTAYARMFGHADAQVAADDPEGQLLPAEATPQQRAARGETFLLEFTLTTASGKRHYYEATGQPIAHEDLGGVVVIRDITERSLHRLQDQFMALASHELRSPLTALQGSLQLLLKGLPTELDGALATRKLAETALAQCRRLARLIEELLDATRLQYGKYSLRLERVDLEPLVAQVIAEVQLNAPRPPIRFDPPGVPLAIQGDAGRLQQILLNLLTNAHTHATISERIDVRLRQVEHEAILQVQDEGPGIAAEQLPHLFERFYQGPGNKWREGGGLGLGLYITKELVLAHRGRITVESVQGQGTTFTLAFPVLDADAPSTGDES